MQIRLQQACPAEQAEFERFGPQVEEVLPDMIRRCRFRIEHLQNLLIATPNKLSDTLFLRERNEIAVRY